MKIQPNTPLWAVPIALSFILGGLLQFMAFLSPTQTNIISLFFFLLILLKTKSISTLASEKTLLLLLAYCALTSIITKINISSLLVYTYYITCMAIAVTSGKNFHAHFTRKHHQKTFINISIFYLAIQALVTTIQNKFTTAFLSLSKIEIGEIDSVFGTLYIQSDSPLGAICTLLLIFAYTVRQPIKKLLTINILGLIIILNGNSTAMQAVFFVCSLALAIDRFQIKASRRILTAVVILLTASLIVIIGTSETADTLFKDLTAYIYNEFNDRDTQTSAGRLAPIGHILFEDIKFTGYGLLTYYNPITKEWLYNSGLSTLYSLYIDSGLIAVTIFYLYYLSLFKDSNISSIKRGCIYLCLIAYSIFNFAPTDIALCFLLGYLAASLNPQAFSRRINNETQ